ncbi:uncharacterized protein LOC110722836 [Chenopodium quinoa]|uniref:Uncharacterized protein n=1 Tax=Chenopodium quinoa TaxID=63459 RepID=A0A803LWZ0_CHEQI|nr:uncharacterized protein LOC110722836 [Chenopodium quinoa]
MAAAPVKSPLHNFPLTFLKWGSKKDQQRCRRSPYDSPLSPPPPPSSSDAEPSNSKGSRSSRNRRNNHNHPPPTPPPAQDDEEERDCGKKPEVTEEGSGVGVGVAVAVNEGEGDGEKGWNLRPRRAAAMKGVSATNSTPTNTYSGVATTVGESGGDNLPKSMRLRGLETQGNGGANGGGGCERRGIKRFWISLSNKEIEEDIYSMTGSKPSRRPKKRPKNVQKQLDNVFPGLWMVGLSPEYYRCLDVPPKR